jgi:hypothetical protein|tara:strand:+ start:678 stop:875 length:198 start_codon:yes stop_codon:yes gene_type:complete
MKAALADIIQCMVGEFWMIAANVRIRRTLHSLIGAYQIFSMVAVLDAMVSQIQQTSSIPVVFAQV